MEETRLKGKELLEKIREMSAAVHELEEKTVKKDKKRDIEITYAYLDLIVEEYPNDGTSVMIKGNAEGLLKLAGTCLAVACQELLGHHSHLDRFNEFYSKSNANLIIQKGEPYKEDK